MDDRSKCMFDPNSGNEMSKIAFPTEDDDIDERVYTPPSRDDGCGSEVSEGLFYRVTDSTRLGKFFIFNQENFKGRPEKKRDGTNTDADRLQNVAVKLGFETEIFKDKTRKQIFHELQNYSKEYHDTNYSCFACAFLTHGRTRNKCPELAAHDHGEGNCKVEEEKNYVNFEEVLQCFTEDKCVSLKGKPKLFFVQACRGEEGDVFHHQTNEHVKKPDLRKIEKLSVAPEAHFFIAHSTLPDTFSVRNTIKGTRFIQTLCNSFDKFLGSSRKFTLVEVLCDANSEMSAEEKAILLQNVYQEKVIVKQIASVTSQLTKDFFFSPNEKRSRRMVDTSGENTISHRKDCNHFLICSSKEYNEQYGDYDQNKLAGTAKKMGFVEHILNYKDLESLLKEMDKHFKNVDYSDSSIFLFALLTVNDSNRTNGTAKSDPTVGDLLSQFSWDKQPKLKNKPKILFVQASNPIASDSAKGLFSQTSIAPKYPELPATYSDMLVTHSRAKEYDQVDDNKYGSLFVSTLCDCLLESQYRLEIMQIMQLVNHKLTLAGVKNVPLVTTHLTHSVTLATKP